MKKVIKCLLLLGTITTINCSSAGSEEVYAENYQILKDRFLAEIPLYQEYFSDNMSEYSFFVSEKDQKEFSVDYVYIKDINEDEAWDVILVSITDEMKLFHGFTIIDGTVELVYQNTEEYGVYDCEIYEDYVLRFKAESFRDANVKESEIWKVIGMNVEDTHTESGESYWRQNSYLSKWDLENRTFEELEYLKAEIYARRGFIFESEEMQDYFSQYEWYLRVYNSEEFDDNCFNHIEKTNISRISDYEAELRPEQDVEIPYPEEYKIGIKLAEEIADFYISNTKVESMSTEEKWVFKSNTDAGGVAKYEVDLVSGDVYSYFLLEYIDGEYVVTDDTRITLELNLYE